MALSLPSLVIINPQSHQSFLLEGNSENSDLYYDIFPPTMFSSEADNYQNFGSSMLGIDQIDQIIVPNCYNSSQKEEEEEYNTLISTFDPNYFNNSIIDNMFDENAQVFRHSVTNQAGYVQESPKQDRVSRKRRYIEGGAVKMSKKQCGIHRKTEASVTASPSKDTQSQSLAAKNRRERISERLRVLQELVPNGTKVDLVTMLEKAISYVKFLQLQVQVLETDEFWPGQGGKALDISQVEEAIDSILSSCHNTDNSTGDQKTNKN